MSTIHIHSGLYPLFTHSGLPWVSAPSTGGAVIIKQSDAVLYHRKNSPPPPNSSLRWKINTEVVD